MAAMLLTLLCPEQSAPTATSETSVPGDAGVSMAAAAAGPEQEDEQGDTIVQAIVVRRDLLKTLEWPVGSVIA